MYQYQNNPIYHQFVKALGVDAATVRALDQVPFLPISFFRTHKIMTGEQDGGLVFESSGTTGEVASRHYIADEAVYRDSLISGFRQHYGNPERYTILALLPGYLERPNASLVYMAKVLMALGGKPDNGFYLNEWDKLREVLERLNKAAEPVLLLGVTFALLDFAEAYPMGLQNIVVMETGGMKGRREEWTRAQVHDFLKKQWHLSSVHSEYGMTELLSQAYSKADGIFETTATMKVLVRDINDPLEVNAIGTGCLNIIDLANVNSCSFIAADDIGNIHADGRFEVLGRVDHSALRGCSLMTA